VGFTVVPAPGIEGAENLLGLHLHMFVPKYWREGSVFWWPLDETGTMLYNPVTFATTSQNY